MWPYSLSPHPQKTSHLEQRQQPYTYTPSHHPPAFQPPTARHILSLPTTANPGYANYASNPFAPKPLHPNSAAPTNPSAFYNAPTYPRPSTGRPEDLTAETPKPHTRHTLAFGVSGFHAPAVHELAYKPFHSTQASSQPQAGGIQNRPFGFQPRPAFPGARFMPESGFGRPGPAAVREGKREKSPSQRVREKLELEGIAEEEDDCEEVDWVRGVVVGRKREDRGSVVVRDGEKRKCGREMTPSQKVRRKLEGLGPREAWDPSESP